MIYYKNIIRISKRNNKMTMDKLMLTFVLNKDGTNRIHNKWYRDNFTLNFTIFKKLIDKKKVNCPTSVEYRRRTYGYGDIIKNKILKDYLNTITELMLDTNKLENTYNSIHDPNLKLTIECTKDILYEILQEIRKFDNINLHKMLKSGKLKPTINKFKYILPQFFKEILSNNLK
jgi:hypothetical protein